MRREIRRLVIARAEGHCEYCLVKAAFLQVDHIVSVKYDGEPDLENLACACILCNQYKGPIVAALASDGRAVRLFHPRQQQWQDHFRLNGAVIEPVTAEGEVTVGTLRLNEEARVKERSDLQASGLYPR